MRQPLPGQQVHSGKETVKKRSTLPEAFRRGRSLRWNSCSSWAGLVIEIRRMNFVRLAMGLALVLRFCGPAFGELFVSSFSSNRVSRFNETKGAPIGSGVFVTNRFYRIRIFEP